MVVPPDDAPDATTVARSTSDPATVPAASYRITVVAGPDKDAAVMIDGSEPSPLMLGQSPACAFRLRDRQVSRRHLSLEVSGRRLRLTDLGSTNGTLVDNVSVVEAYLRGGETITIGETSIRVEVVASATTIPIAAAASFGRTLGASPEMRRLYPLCERVAQAAVPVVIEGETGTGKELLAEAIHESGPRASGPWIVFDCTATHPTLVESDLFGHEKGAFTGATAARKGVFELAHGGTLLIDEIGDLDPALQPKLLRAIERSEIRRVGGEKSIRVDVRIIAATRRDLDREVQAGRFRDDLFHRLAVARIALPPLRRRRGDIAVLARAFAEQLGSPNALPDDLLLRWEDYSWPGNVRELRNAVARQLAFGDLAAETSQVAPELAAELAGGSGVLEQIIASGLPFSVARRRVLDAFERGYVERVLAEHDGNVLRAAEASGIARRHLQRVKARTSKT
jgi:DNA-binding NtrC family response regulator